MALPACWLACSLEQHAEMSDEDGSSGSSGRSRRGDDEDNAANVCFAWDSLFVCVAENRWRSSFGCRANEAVPCVLLSDIVSICSSKGPLNAMRSLCDELSGQRQTSTRTLLGHSLPGRMPFELPTGQVVFHRAANRGTSRRTGNALLAEAAACRLANNKDQPRTARNRFLGLLG